MACMSKNLLKRYIERSKDFEKVNAELKVTRDNDSEVPSSLTMYVTESGHSDNCRQLWISVSATEIGRLLKEALVVSSNQQQDEIFRAAFSHLECSKTLELYRSLARVSEATNV